ncbi:MAG: glycosyltransferase family 4 protein [Candidatus Pacebacteria bacterium]|jgi:glycosyltransferase involved in cell wall biosynthesis|nr:glycosyltransferase family 4 protein [Candidatus Paceibacterota bacterium]MBT4652060.1 glycosyltransferase family 4 protein [Candidatus Paceibacterota bacterium]MBT6756082.1 glycosyltransferase family 4 protein [Candidatus Paceibacterota bacterium]MBT6921675.1 glycosyltransferase family 4 protein [Candidatus Paceibacterota bacterium]
MNIKNNKQSFHFAFDANEANVLNRVGSNVYAFEILKQLHASTKKRTDLKWTVLLAQPPVKDFPKENNSWKYKIVTPRKFWTQWALPLHLFKNKRKYDLLYTPGHYAPRFSSVPYISSIMDLAFLKFPDQFTGIDAFQLKNWTKYSAESAEKIITISEFSKKEINQIYDLSLEKIKVAYPAVSLTDKYSNLRWKRFIKKNSIKPNEYFLYLGTIQPRKNLEKLIETFEVFSRGFAARKLKSSQTKNIKVKQHPQLVIAGKTGWLAETILERIQESPFKKHIILTGFVDDSLKKPLYENAQASLLIGLYEGFGIPPLESLAAGTAAIVSNNSSLPEAVGEAGILVDPENAQDIANAMKKTWNMPKLRKQVLKRKTKKHLKNFTWKKTGQVVLETLLTTAKELRKNGN